MTLPTNPEDRKAIPLYSGVLCYFPAALVRIAIRSREGNEQHRPGESLGWDRSKSDDHLDALARHLTERDLVGVAWRALAALQVECEQEGAPVAPGAINVKRQTDEQIEAFQSLHDEDAPTAHLKAGEAHEHDRDAYERATAAQHDTGE